MLQRWRPMDMDASVQAEKWSHRAQKDSCLTHDCQQVRTMEKPLVNEGLAAIFFRVCQGK